MSIGLTNFKFYRSFRVKSDESDKIKLKLTISEGPQKGLIIEDNVHLIDFNLFSLSFKSNVDIQIDSVIKIEMSTKKIFNKWDFELSGKVIRSFSNDSSNNTFNYGIELLNQTNDSELKYFITDYIASFSSNKLKKFLIKSALSAREININDGVELFNLLNVLYKEFTDSNLKELIEECKHILHCEEVRIWKVNLDNDTLENIHSNSGTSSLKDIQYNSQDVGMSFTNSKCINTFYKDEKNRSEDDYKIKNTLCLPLVNKEQKAIGVIQFNNKLDSQFSLQDEVISNFLTMVVSKFFLNFMPKSKSSSIAHLNPEREDDFIYFGSGQKAASIRSTLKKLKYGRNNIHIVGEVGLGKQFFAKELANSSKHKIFDCSDSEKIDLLLTSSNNYSKKDTLILKGVNLLTLEQQNRFFNWTQFNECQYISTSTEDLNYYVELGKFHKLLHQKLTQSLFHITPLRNRRNDIISITNYFIKIECKKRNLPLIKLDESCIEGLLEYHWPENITQLEKLVIKSFMVKTDYQETLVLNDLPNKKENLTNEEKLLELSDSSIHPYKLMEMINQINKEVS
jgi:transcriptional regulator with GAF, ATPase, and Fis domain